MFQYDDRRTRQTHYYDELLFKIIATYGESSEEALPESFTLLITDPLFERMQKAWNALNEGADIAGLQARDYDIVSSIANQKVMNVRILMQKRDDHHVRLELLCNCTRGTCFFVSEMTLHNSWFTTDSD